MTTGVTTGEKEEPDLSALALGAARETAAAASSAALSAVALGRTQLVEGMALERLGAGVHNIGGWAGGVGMGMAEAVERMGTAALDAALGEEEEEDEEEENEEERKKRVGTEKALASSSSPFAPPFQQQHYQQQPQPQPQTQTQPQTQHSGDEQQGVGEQDTGEEGVVEGGQLVASFAADIASGFSSWWSSSS